jgi:4-hydroxy-tetrahydrodipicolinate reductase
MRLLIVGDGKMGRAVADLAAARGHEATIVGREESAERHGLTAERTRGHDVAVEFTGPDAAPANIERLIAAGIPVVTGTTGWDAELPRITALVEARKGALLHAANFSIGVQLFLRAARALGTEFAGREGFDGFILEEHHAAKRDAPSGTARVLQQRLRDADPAREYPITSVRAGAIPGTHTVRLDGVFETVTLQHTARSRDGFAAGALAAAEWLPGHTGVYTFEAMLFGDRR